MKYVISSTPHIRSNDSIENIMRDVCIALIPACLAGIYFFGLRALLVILISCASCMLFEYLFQKAIKRDITVSDYSALVTGILLALNLPASVPFWIPVVGSFVAIIITKQLFGGLGQNFMNPALAARAFLLTAYPKEMTAWTKPLQSFGLGFDAVSTATPLSILKETPVALTSNDYLNAFLGNIGGCIGETCALALLIGAAYLLYRGIINLYAPISFILTFYVLMFIMGRFGMFTGVPLYELLVGGLILGAFFMATDYSSSPISLKGQIIFGIGCGLLTALIRTFSGYPEGVSFAILIMNLTVPLIDKYVRPRVYGTGNINKGGQKHA